jgi:hypothetical protein
MLRLPEESAGSRHTPPIDESLLRLVLPVRLAHDQCRAVGSMCDALAD